MFDPSYEGATYHIGNPLVNFFDLAVSILISVMRKNYVLAFGNDFAPVKLFNAIPYINKIWLFAECSAPSSVSKIREKAQEVGYEKFYHLYIWREKMEPKEAVESWREFVMDIKNLDNTNSSL